MPDRPITGRPLAGADIAAAAKHLKVTASHVRAIIAVEASGSGFLLSDEDDTRHPKILFEAHIFSRETGGKYDLGNPHLSSPKWNRALYKGGAKEHDRLQEAAELDSDAAYRSASWGLFQIMGFNHQAAGYHNLLDYVGVQYISEGLQLQCGVNFIQSQGLDKFLRQEDWDGFAKGYNGRSYKKNKYHEKLAAAFEKYQTGKVKSTTSAKEIQRALNRVGFNLAVDGKIGSRTEAAIREFQEREGLAVDGILGPQTRRALDLGPGD